MVFARMACLKACSSVKTCLPFRISPESIQQTFIKHLLPLCRPHWKPNQLKFDSVDGGLTNTLIGVAPNSVSPPELILRVDGDFTENFIDRDYEVAVVYCLHEAGIGPPIYSKFANGICYGYFPGRTLSYKELYDPVMSRKVAAKLVRLHATPPPSVGVSPKPRLFHFMKHWMNMIATELPVTKRITDLYGSMDSLKREVEEMERELTKLSCPLVLCHNDLQSRNIIYNDQDGTVAFIDFEYSGVNPLAYDIGNFFNEFAGLDEVDFSLYPSEGFQKWWIRIYLEEAAKFNREDPSLVTSNSVEVIYREANKYSLGSNLLWALWSLLQHQYSSIDQDFLEYGAIRLNEYRSKKHVYLSL